MPAGGFSADITVIRERARQKPNGRPATGAYGGEGHADGTVDLPGL
jgi:hypothetical protein